MVQDEQGQLSRVAARLSRWREQHGGPGQPIPAEFWAAAVQVAEVQGVQTTARALRLDPQRLSRRMAVGTGPQVAAAPRSLARADFVEVDARSVLARGQVRVRLTGRDGEQLEIELDSGASAVDVTAVVQAFWRRCR